METFLSESPGDSALEGLGQVDVEIIEGEIQIRLLEKSFSPLQCSGIGTGCPGRWWSQAAPGV